MEEEREFAAEGEVRLDWSDQEGPFEDGDRDVYAAYPDISGRPGQLIGGTFRLERVIGRGSMGTVWLGTDTRSGRAVAVKMVSRLYLASAEARRRFRREVRAISQIHSRFAVAVIASGETRDRVPYMVMEHLEGETLEAKLEREQRLSVALSVRLSTQVARALARAHELGFVHRDLKPANVFLVRGEDGTLTAKVLDFGVAKFTQENSEDNTETSVPTKTGILLGTPEYMSPEQSRGEKSIDGRSDLYSLGALTFTMLTGRYVVEARSYAEVLIAIARGRRPELHEVAPELPAALSRWFSRACAFEARDRFASAWEQAEALHAAAGLPGSAADHLDTRAAGNTVAPSRASMVDFMTTASSDASLAPEFLTVAPAPRTQRRRRAPSSLYYALLGAVFALCGAGLIAAIKYIWG